MSNYSETVVIPFFQKKITELQSILTVIEANYIVEQHKNKDLSEKIGELSEIKNASIKELEAQLTSSKGELARKISECTQLSDNNSTLVKRIEDLKRVVAQLEQKILLLDSSNKTLSEENSKILAASSSAVRKKRIKEVVLDGSTF